MVIVVVGVGDAVCRLDIRLTPLFDTPTRQLDTINTHISLGKLAKGAGSADVESKPASHWFATPNPLPHQPLGVHSG